MASAIPAALAGLVTAISAAVDLDLVSVHDGLPIDDVRSDWIAIGYNPAEDAAVEFDRAWASLGARRVNETFVVNGVIRSGSGDDNVTTQRTRVFDLLDQVTAAVAGDRTLGGAVQLAAVLGSGSLIEGDTETGAAAGITFRVECEATINQS